VTKQYIEWVGSAEMGEQEVSQEDKVNALTVIHANITTLQERHLLSNAAVAGLQEAVDKLTEQRDEAIADNEQQWQDGYEQGMAEAEEYYYGYMGIDPDETWDALKDCQGNRVEELVEALNLLGEAEGAKAMQAQYELALKQYDEAARQIEQYDRYLYEKREQIAKLKGDLDDDDTEDEDDDSDEE